MRTVEKIDNKKFVIVDLNFRNITSKKAFLRFMKESFDLPNYFSDNIDSLDECLRDLRWFVNDDESIKVRINQLNALKDKNEEMYNLIQESLALYKEHWDKSKLNNSGVVIFEYIS